jgi:acyl dehydratase
VVAFAGLSGDFNPLHTDAEFGKSTPRMGCWSWPWPQVWRIGRAFLKVRRSP